MVMKMAIQKFNVVLVDGTRGEMLFESKGNPVQDLIDTTVKIEDENGTIVRGTLYEIVGVCE
jgi:hypothetical protein